MSEKRNLMMKPLEGAHPRIGMWLWALEDVREGLKKFIKDISQELIDYQPPGSNGIGTLLYHIAVVEADWLYTDVLGQQWGPEFGNLFPHPVRNDAGMLNPIIGESLAHHLHRLDTTRRVFVDFFRQMDIDTFTRPIEMPKYILTPEWAIYHLTEHEAHHRGQISDIIKRLQRQG